MKFIELAEEVLAQREREGVRGFDREMSRWRCHVAPAAFAQKELSDIGARDIRDWLRVMAETDAKGYGGDRKLSRQTISRCQSLVSAVFIEAVERELLESNPSMGVKPKKRVDASDTVEKWAYLTIDEQRALYACEAIPITDRIAIRFAIGTGLRQGELYHLRIADLLVAGDAPSVVVRYGSHKGDCLLPPKSGKKRTVPLFGDSLACSKEWLAMLPSFAPENPLGLVFPQANGNYRFQGKPLGKSDALKKHLARIGVTRRVRWHDLRHTFATNLITGVLGRRWSIEETQVVMGHSSPMVTAIYSHLGDDALKRAARETVAAAPEPIAIVSVPVPKVHPIIGLATRIASAVQRVVSTRMKETA